MPTATYASSFQDAPFGAGPESIIPMVVMDSGLARGACHRAGQRPDPLARAAMTKVKISSKANGMSTLDIDVGDIRPVSVAFTADELVVTLADGSEIATPLA
jgi:hypothetical protein